MDAEARQAATTARNGWLLSAPALILLFIAASGPLIVMFIYAFLSFCAMIAV